MNELILYILLSFCGVLFIIAEMFLPGLIAGITGTVMVLYALAKIFLLKGLGAALIVAGLDAVLLGVFFNQAVKLLPKTRWGRKIMLSKDSSSTILDDQPLQNLIGREIVVRTTLRPTGTIEIDGHVYDARAQDGFVEKGQRVKVIGTESNNLIVSKIQ